MSGLFDQIRFRFLKLLYDGFFVIMIRDRSWQEPLISSLAPRANDRILDFGPGGSATAVALALRYPEASFVGADPDQRAVKKARQRIARRQIGNVVIVETPLHGRLPFESASFDKVVSMLTFHDRLPGEKVAIAREIMRVLRHGGTLHVADYDKPGTARERGLLRFAEYISGPAAAEPHIDGSWTGFLRKAGFAGIRRETSQSVGVGRVSVVRARRR